jgi:hypothetical protein
MKEKDVLLKIEYLYYSTKLYDSYLFETWKDKIWNLDINKLACCDGRMCGCYGVSIRQELEHELNCMKKELEMKKSTKALMDYSKKESI